MCWEKNNQAANKDVKNLLCSFQQATGKQFWAHPGPVCRHLVGREDKGDTLATNPIKGCTAEGEGPGCPRQGAQNPRVPMEGSHGVLWLWGSHRPSAPYVGTGWRLERCHLWPMEIGFKGCPLGKGRPSAAQLWQGVSSVLKRSSLPVLFQYCRLLFVPPSRFECPRPQPYPSAGRSPWERSLSVMV